jgi:hypothetical protein
MLLAQSRPKIDGRSFCRYSGNSGHCIAVASDQLVDLGSVSLPRFAGAVATRSIAGQCFATSASNSGLISCTRLHASSRISSNFAASSPPREHVRRCLLVDACRLAI